MNSSFGSSVSTPVCVILALGLLLSATAQAEVTPEDRRAGQAIFDQVEQNRAVEADSRWAMDRGLAYFAAGDYAAAFSLFHTALAAADKFTALRAGATVGVLKSAAAWLAAEPRSFDQYLRSIPGRTPADTLAYLFLIGGLVKASLPPPQADELSAACSALARQMTRLSPPPGTRTACE